MRFNEQKHTIDYLLINTNVAFELAQTSPNFRATIGQNVDYLSKAANYLAAKNNAEDPVYELTKHSDWIISDAAQDKQVLSIANSTGTTIAHFLSKDANWASSPAAQNVDILLLNRFNGFSVAHALARNETWGATKASQDISVLDNIRTKSTGETVAHYLAKYNKPWWGTSAAFQKEILKLRTTRDQQTVAELAFHRILGNDDEKADAIVRLVKLGQAMSFKSPPDLSDRAILLLIDSIINEIDSHHDVLCKTHISAALYSTLICIQNTLPPTFTFTKLHDHIEEAAHLLHSFIKNNDAARTSLMTAVDDDCDSAREMLVKSENMVIFEGIDQQDYAETVPVEHTPYKLY